MEFIDLLVESIWSSQVWTSCGLHKITCDLVEFTSGLVWSMYLVHKFMHGHVDFIHGLMESIHEL